METWEELDDYCRTHAQRFKAIFQAESRGLAAIDRVFPFRPRLAKAHRYMTIRLKRSRPADPWGLSLLQIRQPVLRSATCNRLLESRKNGRKRPRRTGAG